MSVKFEFSGFDDLQKELEELQNKAKSLEDMEISFDKLFTNSFMQQHANVSSFDDFLSNGKFHAETTEEFEAIPEDEFDLYVSSSTDFDNWNDMLSAATDIYLEKENLL